MKKVLLLGPNYAKNGEVGGIVVSFELMKNEFKEANIESNLIDLNKKNYKNKLFAVIQIILKSLYLIPSSSSIVLNGTANDFKLIVPILVFFSKLFRKKIILRKFAGSFIDEFENSPKIIQKLILFSLKHADTIFFQTKYLVEYFKKYNIKTLWLPTSRKASSIQREDTPYQKRFIYLGHICEEKGIYDLITLSTKLDHSYTIDLYGALIEPELKILIKNSSLNYFGELNPKNILSTLCEYDVLILPSYREGYPGVVIEALSVGLPIIATNLPALTEMIDPTCGILIPPKNINQLEKAVRKFNRDNYNDFSQSAHKQFKLFDSSVVTQKVIHLL